MSKKVQNEVIIRKPKVGDTIYCVWRNNNSPEPDFEGCVTRVGVKYFYIDDIAFIIDSFVDGCWSDKEDASGRHKLLAYPSQEIYEKQMLKEKQIYEIHHVELINIPAATIQKIYDIIFKIPDVHDIEEWEVFSNYVDEDEDE